MRSHLSLAMLALSAVAASSPALAQSAAAPATTPVAAVPLCHANISKEARKALFELQTAVFAKDMANISPKLAAAQLLAKTSDDKCFIGQMQMKAATDRNDLKGLAAAIEAQLASGSVPAATSAAQLEDLGQLQYGAKAYADAHASFERSLRLDPSRSSAVLMLAETRVKQNRGADALPLFQRAIAAELAAGRTPAENWYKRPIAIAFDAKNPAILGLTRAWVAAYPSATSWRDTIRIHATLAGLSNVALIDMYRLARLNRALAGNADYGTYAEVALGRGFPGEAKAVLDEGFAAGAIDRNQSALKAIHASATTKAAGDRAAIDEQAKTVAAGGTAKSLMTLAEAYYGYGAYATAATLVRAAQGKAGVDADLANLRLGMALAASGDKAGAKAALDLVTGSQAEIARYWLTYLATRS